MNKKKNLNLNISIDYYTKPLRKGRIQYLNLLNNVETEKVKCFSNFISSLLKTVEATFLGDDVIFTEDQYKSHFNWCWKRNILNSEKQGVYFEEPGEHYYYFYKYVYDVFYTRDDRPENIWQKFVTFWKELMSKDTKKTQSEYDLFINLYRIFCKYLQAHSKIGSGKIQKEYLTLAEFRKAQPRGYEEARKHGKVDYLCELMGWTKGERLPRKQ
jgi:hypothetical protein